MTYYSAFLEWAKEQNGETFLCIRIPVQAGKLIQTRKCKELALGVDDGRSITPAQRRKAYATLGDISNYTGYTVEAAKEIMKVENKVIQTVLAIPLPKEKSGTEAKNGNEMNEKTDRKK